MGKSLSHGETSYSAYQPVERSLAVKSLSTLIKKNPLKTLISTLGKENVFLVGGTVRDACLGNANVDLDCATSLSMEKVLSLANNAKLRLVETGIAHGTVLFVIDGEHIEVTAFREPSDRSKHIPAQTLEADLAGRDFTINAMAFSVKDLELVDPYSGYEDLKNSILRSVGDANLRITEDPLRILRAIRFGPAANRTLDSETLKAITTHKELLKNISPERIKAELDKILLSANASAAFRFMAENKILEIILPELIPSIGFEQNQYHIHDVFEHSLWVLDRAPQDLILKWTALFHDIGKPHTLSVGTDGMRHFYKHEIISAEQSANRMRELKFSNSDREEIELLVRHHMRPLDCGPAGVRRIMRDLGSSFERWLSFKNADSPPKGSEEELDRAFKNFMALVNEENTRRKEPNYGKLAVDGNDLLEAGFRAGPNLGRILKALEEIVIEDPSLNSKEFLLKKAKEI